MVVPTVTKMRSRLVRVAPMVRRMAMSRVLARTSMIKDDRMLNTATRMMIDRTTNMATRSTANASNNWAFMVRQSWTTARPPTRAARGRRISPTWSGSTVCTSNMPTASPSRSSVCASSSGMTT